MQNRKLTEEQVQQIRDLYALTSMSYRALAAQFGVGISTVQRIVSDRSPRRAELSA